MRIALIEDDQAQADVLKLWLEESGHTCQHFSEAKPFMRTIKHDSFDVVILDWVLPDVPGDEVVAWMRSELDWYVPVLFTTVRDSEEDIIHGLKSGADDYMVKPVKPGEMLARLVAISRRSQTQSDTNEQLKVGDFTFDPASKSVKRSGETIEMTHKEYDLSSFLFRNLGRIVSRGHLLETVWGKNSELNTRTVDTHISRIRNKLSLSPENGWKLSAIYQHGYRLEQVED